MLLNWHKNIEMTFIKEEDYKLKSFKSYKLKQMEDDNFKTAYKELEPEFEIIKALINARARANITQKELSERTGIAQTEISRLENGTRNPSVKILQKLADGLGMKLKIEFVPKIN